MYVSSYKIVKSTYVFITFITSYNCNSPRFSSFLIQIWTNENDSTKPVTMTYDDLRKVTKSYDDLRWLTTFWTKTSELRQFGENSSKIKHNGSMDVNSAFFSHNAFVQDGAVLVRLHRSSISRSHAPFDNGGSQNVFWHWAENSDHLCRL